MKNMKRMKKLLASAMAMGIIFSTVQLPVNQQVYAATGSPVMISAVVPDTDNVGGADAYEYVELYNTSNKDLNLNDYPLHYMYGSSDTVWAPVEENVVIKSGEAIVLWIINQKNTALTAADFNKYYNTSLEEGKNLFHINCDGLHNSKERILQIQNKKGEALCQIKYNDGDEKKVQLNKEITFSYDMENVEETRIGYDGDLTPAVVGGNQKPSKIYEFEDEPEETGSPSEEVTTSPSAAVTTSPSVAVTTSPSAEVTTAPAVRETTVSGSPLVITELLPDSENKNSADAYEFIEVFNNSNENISFKDYKLYYNYPDNGDNSDILWESVPGNMTIPAGEVIVFWIKNGSNNEFTADDFNKKFGTSLVIGQNLVEIYSGGMANSGARALRLTTNTKTQLDFAAYNMNGVKNTAKDESIQFKYDTDTGLNVMTPNMTPTPGTVGENELPDKQVVLGANEKVPVIDDLTGTEFSEESNFEFKINVHPGDRSVKSVYLYIKDNLQEDYECYNLLQGEDNLFSKVIEAVDLTGKRSYTYKFEVSDGTHIVSTEEKQVASVSRKIQNVRLNMVDGQIISGVQNVIASSDISGSAISMKINGDEVSNTAVSVENGVKFVFEVSQTDTFFKNAVAVGDNLIGVFDDGTYEEWKTIEYEIPVEYFEKKKETTISIHAGNKANPLVHDEENNDDFVVKNIRLILPTGHTLRAAGYENPETVISMGDSSGKIEILDAVFKVPESGFNAVRTKWDTTKIPDGNVEIEAGCNGTVTKASVIVDNTAPEITSNIEKREYKGKFTIEASAKDLLLDVTEFTAELDGEDITLPYETSSISLKAGEHRLHLMASDSAGNVSEKTIRFITPEENPEISKISPENNSSVSGETTLSAVVTDTTNDEMTVVFKKGEIINEEKIQGSEGFSHISGTDEETDDKGYPFYKYEIDLSDKELSGSSVRLQWNGSANAESRVCLYAYNVQGAKWDLLQTQFADEDAKVSFDFTVEAIDYADNGKMQIMIQNGVGYVPVYYATDAAAAVVSNSAITTGNVLDVDRNDYDFTFALETDTQYYNEDFDGIYRHQINIHDWLLANQPRINLQYLFHNGDIIDDWDAQYEWENADAAYKMLDNANLPYGVLAGNHDVGHKTEDYSEYYKYFGEDRYINNPWYGESYKNNRGHYDLISVDGIDFIMVYMGWGIGDEEIEWLNKVLQQYPERKAILNFHEYLLASKGLGEQPQRIYNEVVAVNPNVCMVLSGHYHSASTRIDEFDDDNDGVNDRAVYQMLFDYQSLEEGGRGYIRLMHFSLEQQQIIVKTYSPSEDSYSSGAFDESIESFVIPFEAIGISPEEKYIEEENVNVQLYTSQVLGKADNIQSGTRVNLHCRFDEEETIGWYVEAYDNYGGLTRSDVNYINVKAVEPTETPAATGTPNATQSPSATGTPNATQLPSATGTPNATQSPLATGTPNATQSPLATGTPAATNPPKATSSPNVTDNPSTSPNPVWGDVDGNDIVDLKDAVLVLKAALGIENL